MVISITKPVSLLFSDKSGNFHLDSVVCLFVKETFIIELLSVLSYHVFWTCVYVSNCSLYWHGLHSFIFQIYNIVFKEVTDRDSCPSLFENYFSVSKCSQAKLLL